MPTISITVSTAIAARIATAIGYQATVNGVPNPVTAAQAIKDWIANDIKAAIKNYEAPIAATTAANNASADVDSTVVVT